MTDKTTITTTREPGSPAAPDASQVAARTPGRRKPRRILMGLSLAWLGILVLAAVFADVIPGLPHYSERVGAFAERPNLSLDGLLGTDSIGRSNLSRIIFGARISLTIAIVSTLIGLSLGLLFGMLAGYYRGAADAVATITANSIAALPPLVLLLALVAAIGASLTGITIALGVVIADFYIRIAKGTVIANASREYVLAAKALGAHDARILLREILPNLIPVLAAVIPMAMAILIVVEGSLSFLGYGIPPPMPSWGQMIASGADLLRDQPHVLIGPVVALFLTVVSLNTLGDHFGSHVDVREGQL